MSTRYRAIVNLLFRTKDALFVSAASLASYGARRGCREKAWRGDTSVVGRTARDLYSIKNWCRYADLKILMLTFGKGFVAKAAY
jgi:hypothetical protein